MRDVPRLLEDGCGGSALSCRGKRLDAVKACVMTCVAAALAGCASSTNQALYLTMRDGTKIAIDVWRPADLGETERIPTIIRATRYWRAYDVKLLGGGQDPGPGEARFWNPKRYALVIVDARGSGASYGVRGYPYSDEETADYGEVVDWIVAQPWSNGRVGAYGVSYAGQTAALIGALRRPAVKAVVPRFIDFDVYTDLGWPGGVFNEGFVREWGKINKALDKNDVCAAFEIGGLEGALIRALVVGGVKPVDADRDRSMLAEAVAEHAGNLDVYKTGLTITYKDDRFKGRAVEELGTYRRRTDAEAGNVAYFAWASWLDAGTANGVLSRFATYKNAQRVLIGAWNHGADYDADPFKPRKAPLEMGFKKQQADIADFFDAHLKGESPPEPVREIRYYTMNEGVWKSTTVWPPTGFEKQTLYMGPERALSARPPKTVKGEDVYTVDFEATTGPANRWWTQLGDRDVYYGHRAEADKRLLTYTSAPLEQDTEITGHAVVTLYVTSTGRDGAFFVYLEDVAPDGKVTYITEGILRALHRKVSHQPPPYKVFGPYHTFHRKDGAVLTADQVADLTFALLPTSVLIEKGHRVRVAIAGHDKGTFRRIPETGHPVITVKRSTDLPSKIVLPMMRR